MKYERVAVVLSGGGAKAAAHVGVMRALEEWEVKPAHYVGTSMGAVVAAMFACGLDYDDVLKRMLLISRQDVATPSTSLLLGPFATSLLSGKKLRDAIRELVPAEAFSDLKTPLTVTAVDSRTGQLALFGAMGFERVSLVQALYASCALPIYYPPAAIQEREFVDGGLRAVLPLDVANEAEPDLIVASEAGPSFFADPVEPALPVPPMVTAHNESMRILMAAQTEETIARWRDGPVPLVLVRPRLGSGATFAVSSVVGYVEEGYRAARRALREYLDGE
jgi:NTE family protein